MLAIHYILPTVGNLWCSWCLEPDHNSIFQSQGSDCKRKSCVRVSMCIWFCLHTRGSLLGDRNKTKHDQLIMLSHDNSWLSLAYQRISLFLGNVSKVVVVGLSCASRIFFRVLQFFSLHKINLSLIHLSYQTGPPLITVFLHWRGLPCINVIIIFRGEKAFICNLQQHWFTIRKLGKQVQYY